MKKLHLALVAMLGMHALSAATIDTQLSADETALGSSVQLQIRVVGSTNVELPGDLQIDDIDSRQTGKFVSTQISFPGGQMVATGTYIYTLTPLREGTFDIPAIDIVVDGTRQKTTPRKLIVRPGVAPRVRPMPGSPPASQGGGTSRSSSAEADGRLAFAKVIVPKKNIYAGEVVPVEVLFYFANDENNPSARVQFRALQDVPILSGEGFTAQKLAPPSQTREIVGDVGYVVLTYKTAITAVKSGDLMTPKASFEGILAVPAETPADMHDIFGRFFGGQGIPGMMDEQQVTITSDPEAIKVKALPSEGRPAGFSGAIGDFTIGASADPLVTAAGDPVSLKIAISGRGNFDAMDDPKLSDTTGWRVYPPTSKFEASDVIGFSGRKNFEMPMVALQPQTETPVATFSYFDPDKSQYFTLTSQPVAIEAAAAPATPAPPSTATAASAATPTPTPTDRELTATRTRSWHPVLLQPWFWVANGAAAALVIAALAAQAVRRASRGAAGRRAARRRERDRALGGLARGTFPEGGFDERVLEVLAIQAELEGRASAMEFVREQAAAGRDVGDLLTVLARTDEAKFSGGARAAATLDVETRARIVRALKELCR